MLASCNVRKVRQDIRLKVSAMAGGTSVQTRLISAATTPPRVRLLPMGFQLALRQRCHTPSTTRRSCGRPDTRAAL